MLPKAAAGADNRKVAKALGSDQRYRAVPSPQPGLLAFGCVCFPKYPFKRSFRIGERLAATSPPAQRSGEDQFAVELKQIRSPKSEKRSFWVFEAKPWHLGLAFQAGPPMDVFVLLPAP